MSSLVERVRGAVSPGRQRTLGRRKPYYSEANRASASEKNGRSAGRTSKAVANPGSVLGTPEKS